MRGLLGEFRAFIVRGNLVDLAVAVAIGAAFTTVVNSLVKDLVTPLIAAVGGKPDFGSLTFTIGEGTFRYGSFLNALITFLVVAAVLFFLVIKPVNTLLDALRPEPAVDRETRECPECLSAIPSSARRCAFCTAEVGTAPAQ